MHLIYNRPQPRRLSLDFDKPPKLYVSFFYPQCDIVIYLYSDIVIQLTIEYNRVILKMEIGANIISVLQQQNCIKVKDLAPQFSPKQIADSFGQYAMQQPECVFYSVYAEEPLDRAVRVGVYSMAQLVEFKKRGDFEIRKIVPVGIVRQGCQRDVLVSDSISTLLVKEGSIRQKPRKAKITVEKQQPKKTMEKASSQVSKGKNVPEKELKKAVSKTSSQVVQKEVNKHSQDLNAIKTTKQPSNKPVQQQAKQDSKRQLKLSESENEDEILKQYLIEPTAQKQQETAAKDAVELISTPATQMDEEHKTIGQQDIDDEDMFQRLRLKYLQEKAEKVENKNTNIPVKAAKKIMEKQPVAKVRAVVRQTAPVPVKGQATIFSFMNKK